MRSNRLKWLAPMMGTSLLVGVVSLDAPAQSVPGQPDAQAVQRSALPRASVPQPAPKPAAAPRDPAITSAAVQAATQRAVENLYLEVANLPLTSRLTVGQFVNYMEARPEMLKGLAEAEQIGAPRWNDSTVQVSLEIPAGRVATALKRIAAARPKVSPVRPDQIDYAANTWVRRSFAADGASLAPRGVVDLRPNFSPRWQAVGDEAREKALASATQDAVSRAMEGVSPVRLADKQTIGDGFAQPQIGQRVRDWLSTRPITQVDFREDGDLYVEMVLAVNEQDYFETVRSAFAGQDRVPFPKDPEEVKRVEREFYANFRPAIGRAGVGRDVARDNLAGPRKGVQLPNREPDWVEQTISVQGVAPFNVKQASAVEKLRVVGKAEQDAFAKLRERLDGLTLDGTTVGEAARQDPRIEAAIRRSLNQADLSRTTLRAGDNAVAEVSLDLRVLWDELRR